jgi:hypothetical protein
VTRRGTRSVYAAQRRWLSRFISELAFRDHELAESDNRVSPEEQRAAVIQKFKFSLLQDQHLETQGAVLSDSRGRGTLQQVGADDV